MKCAETKGFLLLMCWVLSPELGVRPHLILTGNVALRAVLVGGGGGPLSAAPIRRITVTRADVSLAANITRGRGRRVTLPFVSRAASCVTLAASWLTAELQAVREEHLRLWGEIESKRRNFGLLSLFRFLCSCVEAHFDLVLHALWCCRGGWHPVPAWWPLPTTSCSLRGK